MSILKQRLDTAESTAGSTIPAEAEAIIPLEIPGDVYVVRAAEGRRETLITPYDLAQAEAGGNPVSPSWSDPAVLIETYRLGQLLDVCGQILSEMFGDSAFVRPAIQRDPESLAPSLVLWLNVPRARRGLRHEFIARYAAETIIPKDSPVPALLWEYHDAVRS